MSNMTPNEFLHDVVRKTLGRKDAPLAQRHAEILTELAKWLALRRELWQPGVHGGAIEIWQGAEARVVLGEDGLIWRHAHRTAPNAPLSAPDDIEQLTAEQFLSIDLDAPPRLSDVIDRVVAIVPREDTVLVSVLNASASAIRESS